MRPSPLQAHQCSANRAEHQGSIGSAAKPAEPVYLIGQSLQGAAAIRDRQQIHQLGDQDRQDLGHACGRQHGRRARRLRKER